MGSTPTEPMRANSQLFALILMVVTAIATGCMSRRNVDSPYMPPAVDYSRHRWANTLENLRQQPESMLPRTDYLLGPGDILSISVVGRPDLLGQTTEDSDTRPRFVVSQSPFLVLPFIGSVRVHGKTPEQFQEDLTAAYSRIVKDPEVFVTVEKFHWNQVSVLGSVRAPGRFALEPGDTLLDAIFRAGGLTLGGRTGELPPARILKIYREVDSQRRYVDIPVEELLARIRETGTLTPREEIILPLDSFLLGGDLTHNITLQPGDIVYIPPAGTVTVHGAVRNARVVFLGPGIRSLAQVITEVGGLEWRAAGTVEILRPRLDGTAQSIYIDARGVMDRNVQDVMIEDNDQVFVYRHTWRNILASIGDVLGATASAGVNATYNPVP